MVVIKEELTEDAEDKSVKFQTEDGNTESGHVLMCWTRRKS